MSASKVNEAAAAEVVAMQKEVQAAEAVIETYCQKRKAAGVGCGEYRPCGVEACPLAVLTDYSWNGSKMIPGYRKCERKVN